METVFGDGSPQRPGRRLHGQAARRRQAHHHRRELFTTMFSHAGSSGKAKVAFAAPYPGTIIPLQLDQQLRAAASSARRTASSAPRAA
jgi:uncharacterized protein (AIM24 family)